MEIKLLSSFSEGSKAKSCSAEDSKTKINRKTKILEKKFIAMIIVETPISKAKRITQ
jgi:tRNA A58 N-methylase Trm61